MRRHRLSGVVVIATLLGAGATQSHAAEPHSSHASDSTTTFQTTSDTLVRADQYPLTASVQRASSKAFDFRQPPVEAALGTTPGLLTLAGTLTDPPALPPVPKPPAPAPAPTPVAPPAPAPAPPPAPPPPPPPPPAPVAGGPSPSQWAALRNCESGDDYQADTGNGYYGAYQFSLTTWQSLGYSGLPSAAPPAVQDAAAQQLYHQAGWSPWPVCSVQLGFG
jgi:hypothetical protein